jgi:hypothetical protein
MGGLGGARRRHLKMLGGTVAAVAVAVAVPAWMLIAGAAVTNPGNVKVGMTTTIHAADFDLDAMKLSAPADATLTSNGALTIPQANLKFAGRDVVEDLDIVGDNQSLKFSAASAFTGNVNPTTGVVTLSGKLKLVFTASGGDDLVDDDDNPIKITCTSPTFNVSLSTANGGIAYNQTTGKATVVSPGLDIAELPEGAAGCHDWDADVNAMLDLPAASVRPARVADNPLGRARVHAGAARLDDHHGQDQYDGRRRVQLEQFLVELE